MHIKTKCFGEVEIQEDKIVYFPEGILGFEKLKNFTIVYDSTGGEKSKIQWLQSTDEPELALPVMNPFDVLSDYNPTVEDELLKIIGDVTKENIVVLLTVTVPEDVKKATVNLKAPVIINSDERLGTQVIVEDKNYVIKYPIIQTGKEEDVC